MMGLQQDIGAFALGGDGGGEVTSAAARPPEGWGGWGVSDQIVGPLNAKRNLVVQIQSSHLPRLRQLIATLLEQHYPFELLGTSFENYWLRSETYSELEGALENIYASSQTLCPTPAKSSSIRTNDKDLEEIKFYRLHGLASHLDGEFTTRIVAMMSTCSRLLEPMFVTTDPTERFRGEVSRCFESIEDSQKWLNDSELHIVQCEWPNQKDKINERLEVVSNLINQIAFSLEMNDLPASESSDDEPPASDASSIDPLASESFFNEPPNEALLDLAKLLIPIIKISRLFFQKLSTRGMDRKQFPKFTQMCSHELNTMAVSPQCVADELGKVDQTFRDADRAYPGATFSRLIEQVQVIETQFKEVLLLILLHFLPIISETENEFLSQNYFKTWFTTWKTLLTIAITNFVDAAEVHQEALPPRELIY
ncbi:hypothetical protein MJO28_008973 [Puccinia striiformis f. sp. tritici]|uniref:Uncharacterized protein n=1 Tax=Puccinia striiformis f. sp. tritici TaxID=168172 RepID=A0ACC0ECJ5_9BASI|nr:hypothetical protein MJO28_008973 [Puccinia striiformis f. sp. tritici]